MRLELEVLSVSQTGFLFVVVVNIWGNWGPEQWLKQCRARDEIWDLGKGGWYVQGSFLPSFPPSLFSIFPSFSFLPSLLSFCLSFSEHHPLRVYFKEFEEEKYHWTKSREYQQGGASWMTSIPKLPNNPFPGPPTYELHKFVWICVPELDGSEDAYSFKTCSQEMDVKAGRKRYMFWPSSIWTSLLCLENFLPEKGEPTSQS